MLDPHVALFKNFVLLLPQNEHHFKMSGQDSAEKGKKMMIESEIGYKTLYLLYAKKGGEIEISFIFNTRLSVKNMKPVLIKTNIIGYVYIHFEDKLF